MKDNNNGGLMFKSGACWKACYDPERGLFTAEKAECGSYALYEIDKDIYDRLGDPEITDRDSLHLLYGGRKLYMEVNDRCGPPYTVVLDKNYAELCPWVDVQGCGPVWSPELTDAAVEVFDSQKNNREQRRKDREQRDKDKEP